MIKYSFACLFIFISGWVAGAPVLISGIAESYPGSRIAVFGIADYISGKRLLIQSAEINDNGKFTLSFEIEETQSLILNINRIEAVLYAEPGASYQVVFPPAASADVRRFDRTSVSLSFVDLTKDDINLLIRDFNSDFVNFVSTHYYDFAVGEFRGSDAYLKKIGEHVKVADIYKGATNDDSLKKAIEPGFSGIVHDFIKVSESKFSNHFDNRFFQEYVEFSLAELELISGMKRSSFYAKYFMSRDIPFKNPAFMNCFSVFYANYLVNHDAELQSSINRLINVERDPSKLIELFRSDSSALSVHMRSLAVINGLKEIYHNKNFNRAAIEKLLSMIKSDLPEIQNIASNTLTQIIKNRENWLMDDFTLLDEAEEKWTLSAHLGRPVYILFFAAWNPSSCKEMIVMQKLKEKYGRDILFVAICMDDNHEQFKKYLTDHKDQDVVFLYGNSDPLISEKCSVRSIPHAILLDQDGRTMFAHARKPSEGIQADLEKLISRNAKQEGPKTWKD